jgi:hypothetical protein
MEIAPKNCAACHFFWPTRNADRNVPDGVCRRYPPTVVTGQTVGVFPAVWDEDWCGEFTPRNTEAKSEAPDEQP